VTDAELDERILAVLSHARQESDEGKDTDPAMTSAALAAHLSQPQEHVQARLQELAIGSVKESEAIPDAWMIVRPSDRH
jgi:hypothetical protein